MQDIFLLQKLFVFKAITSNPNDTNLFGSLCIILNDDSFPMRILIPTWHNFFWKKLILSVLKVVCHPIWFIYEGYLTTFRCCLWFSYAATVNYLLIHIKKKKYLTQSASKISLLILRLTLIEQPTAKTIQLTRRVFNQTNNDEMMVEHSHRLSYGNSFL